MTVWRIFNMRMTMMRIGWKMFVLAAMASMMSVRSREQAAIALVPTGFTPITKPSSKRF